MKVTDVILVDICHREHWNLGPATATIDFNISM